MATTTSNMSATTHFVKTGLGGAGNFRRVTESRESNIENQVFIKHTAPSCYTTGIGGAGNSHSGSEMPTISHEEARIRDRMIRENSPSTWHYGIGGAGNLAQRDSSPSSASTSSTRSSPSSTSTRSTRSGFGKLKAHLHSHIDARNSRVSLFEAWQRKLPAYSSEKEHRVNKFSSSSSYNSDAETLVSKMGDLTDRVIWRMDRIVAQGLDDGLESSKPAYIKLEA